MLRINKIKIKSFFSLGDVELQFKNGVYLVYGYNKDVIAEVNTSNGAGKTSLFNAIYQSFFNKNLKDTKGKIDSVSNIYMGIPYTIETEFNYNGDKYIIINDRRKNIIKVFKNDKDISVKGIPNSLKLIKNILGFDFNVLTSLTYLNQQTLDGVIDISYKNNILYQFFELDRLKNLENLVKKEVKNLVTKKEGLKVKEQEYYNYLALLEKTEIEEINYEKDLIELEQELQNLINSDAYKSLDKDKEKIKEIENSISNIDKEIHSLKSKKKYIIDMQNKFKKGVCPVCNQKVENKSKELQKDLEKVINVLDTLIKEKNKLVVTLSPIKEQYQNKYKILKKEKKELEDNINLLKLQSYKAEKNKELIKEFQAKVKEYKEELQIIKKQVEDINQYLELYQKVLKLLSSGKIIDIYLSSYVKLLKANLKEYLKQTNFNFKIVPVLEYGKLVYNFYDEEKLKSFYQLSSGERTRASLILLLATLKSLEQLTGLSFNFIVFDEILGVLDEEGLEFIKKAINRFKDNKAVFIITHQDEITTNYADFKLNVIKENNIAKITLEEI